MNMWRSFTTDVKRWMAVFRFTWLLKPVVPRVVFMMGARAGNTVLGMFIPLVLRDLIDNVKKTGDSRWPVFEGNVVRLFQILIAALVFSLVVTYFSTQIEQLLKLRLTRHIQDKWRRMVTRGVQRWGVGEHIFRAVNDVENVGNTLLSVIPSLVQIGLQFVVFAIAVERLNSHLFALYLVSLPPLIVATYLYSRKSSPIQHVIQSTSSRINDVISEYMGGVLSVKLFQRERFFGRVLMRLQGDKLRWRMRKWRIDTIYQSSRWGISAAWSWAIVAYGLSLVMKGELSLGTLIAVQWYLNYLNAAIDQFGDLMTNLVIGSVSAQRLSELFAAPEESGTQSTDRLTQHISADPIPAKLELRRATFGYTAGRPLIRDLTATFAPGRMIGITGPSGVGKTTLVALITRLHELGEGEITLNGVPLQNYHLGDLRTQVSVASQNPFLIFGTIRDNIAFGKLSVTDDEIVHAAELADAHLFISELEQGYDTQVSELMPVLSLGQKQRVGLARSIVKGGSLLICDECLTGVDHISRHKILQSLKAMTSSRTVVLISHDPVALSSCEKVLVMLSDGSYCFGPEPEVFSTGPYASFFSYLDLKAAYE